MFNKFGARDTGPETKGEPATQTMTPSRPEVTPVARKETKPKQTLSVIGKTVVMKGDLIADEDLLIQGRFEGKVKQNAPHLTVGANGNVDADIDGKTVLVQGTVRGDIRGDKSVVIEPSARVHGNIYSSNVGLQEGARFKGSIDSYAPAAGGQQDQQQKSASSDSSVDEEIVDKILDA